MEFDGAKAVKAGLADLFAVLFCALEIVGKGGVVVLNLARLLAAFPAEM